MSIQTSIILAAAIMSVITGAIHLLIKRDIQVVGHDTVNRITAVIAEVQYTVTSISKRLDQIETDLNTLHTRLEYLEKRDRERKD